MNNMQIPYELQIMNTLTSHKKRGYSNFSVGENEGKEMDSFDSFSYFAIFFDKDDKQKYIAFKNGSDELKKRLKVFVEGLNKGGDEKRRRLNNFVDII
jgi:hypothetical protein